MGIELIELRNGRQVPESVLGKTLIAVETIAANPVHMVPFIELVTMAKDAGHEPFGNSGQVLESYGLLKGGKMHRYTRDVIDAAYEFRGVEVIKQNPRAA